MAKIKGTAGNDVLIGTVANDVIDGGLGIDTMTGGLGYDVYYVDNPGDLIFENSGEGTDTVRSTVSYTLPDNVENMTLTGKASIDATGNDWDNILTGNKGNNILDGGAGSDTLIGGSGNDIYVINTFSSNGINDGQGDFIIDSSGNDTVTAFGAGLDTVTYILQKGLENVVFDMPTTAITLTGNDAKNTLITSDGDDILDGGKGADTMNGGDGMNTYYVDNKNDVIIDTFNDLDVNQKPDDSTADTASVSVSYVLPAAAKVEIVTLTGTKSINVTGSDTANVITGNSAENKIHGGGGNDELHGGGGKDTLYGDLGADTFYFDTSTAFNAPVTIKDFSVAQGDKLDITDILTGYDPLSVISNFVHIVDKGKNTIVEVNTVAPGSAAHFVTVATLWHVNGLTGEFALNEDGTLITTHS